MSLNKYDYKRIEELLEEMIREVNFEIVENEKEGAILAEHGYCLTTTLELIKERQKNGAITGYVINSKDAGGLFTGNWLGIGEDT